MTKATMERVKDMGYFLSVIAFALLLTGCAKKTKCPPRNIEATEMQGKWTDARPVTSTMFAGTQYQIDITADSFRMVLHSWSDIPEQDGCITSSYNEYTAGHYSFDRSTGTAELT